MRLATETAIHAIGLLKHASENNHGMSGPAKLAMYLPLASHPVFQAPSSSNSRRRRRQLEEMVEEPAVAGEEWFDEGDVTAASASIELEQADDDLMSFMEHPRMKEIKDQCHVDVEGLLMAGMMQAMTLHDSMGSSSSQNQAALLNAVTDPDYIQNVLAAFGDFEGQRMCTDEDVSTVMGAYSDFMSCTGISEFIGKIAVSGFDAEHFNEEMARKCRAVNPANPFLSAFPTEGEELAGFHEPTSDDLLHCMASIFGPNNPIGDYLRDVYQHPNKYCQCMHDLGDKVPDCTVEEEGIKVSMSLIKSGTCVFGVGCEALHDYCTAETDALEACLPEKDADFDCTEKMMECVQHGAYLPMIPAMISTTLPDTCQMVADEATARKYEHFQHKCMGKKDWVALDGVDDGDDEFVNGEGAVTIINEVESTDDISEMEEIKVEEQQIAEEEEELEEEEAEIKEELKIANSEQVIAENLDEEEEEEEQEDKRESSASLPLAGIAIVACAVVASFFVIKKRMATAKTESRKDFAQVSTGGFEYEDDADAGHFIA